MNIFLSNFSRVCAFLCVVSAAQILADPPAFDGTAGVELSDNGVLVFPSGTITLTADRVISLPGSGVNATIQIGAALNSGTVTVTPSAGAPKILLFDVINAGSVLEVELLNHLIFQGNGAHAMFIGIRGKGEVRFRMPCGKNITFTATSSTNAGAHVRILMAQNAAEMQQHSQLSFVPWSTTTDSVNTDLNKHSLITIGQNSSFTFVSQLKSGQIDSSGATDYGYGAASFEPFTGKGRMILKIDAGATAVDFKDGAFNIYGNYVAGSGISDTDVLPADLRANVTYKYRAGIAATVRIDNKVALAAESSGNRVAYVNDPFKKRGLVILNYNNSFPRLANNYDQTVPAALPEDLNTVVGLTSSKWFVANTVQTGFVLGNNGILEVEGNRFVDYFAGRTNTAGSNFPVAGTHVATGATTSGGTHDSSKVKLHNPSALIVDGYAYRKTGTTAAADVLFEYDAPTTENAQIILRGNAGLFVRVAADNDADVIANLTMDTNGVQKSDFTGAYISGTIGRAAYDGASVMMLDQNGNIDSRISMTGEVAMDVEGPLTIESTPTFNDATPARGFINIPSLLTDYRGVEMEFSTSLLREVGVNDVSRPRPLPITPSVQYYRYNNSQILVNDAIKMVRVDLVHNDVGRDVSAMGTGNAQPIIVGGELPSLKIAKQFAENPSAWILDYTGSPIYLENSRITCHESLVSAGVRWAVHDALINQNENGSIVEGEDLSTGDNTSIIAFRHRGYSHDLEVTGVGRYFQLGSRLNTMADGTTINPIVDIHGLYPQSSLRDAFIDVYRQRPVPTILQDTGDEKNTIRLRLLTEYEPGVAAAEKSIHVVHIADRSQINLGWPAGQYQDTQTISGNQVTSTFVEVDSRYAPWEFTNEVLSAVQGADPENQGGYRFSPYRNGRGELQVAGSLIYFEGAGRYNSSGLLSPTNNEFAPRTVRDGGGIIYAHFGGELSATTGRDVLLNTVVGRRTCQITAGGGVVSVPSDQLIFQPYGKIETCGFDPIANQTPSLLNSSSAGIVSINVNELPVPEGFEPVKGFERRSPTRWPYRKVMSRSTNSVAAPITMPSSGLIVMGSGDSITQVQICGATRANPFNLWLSGNATGFARVREFVCVPSDPVVLGEGPVAALFLDHGARIGLGSRNYTAQSVHALNQLGLDTTTLFPNGNGVIDVNSDLVISDKLPIIATTAFGAGNNTHQLLFYSPVPREIRILAGGELDLSSFGRCGGAAQQQIAFGGQVKLVIEPGAKIRFPSTVTGGGPVLYFNDDSQCVFLGNEMTDIARWNDTFHGADAMRTKILGIGQIWLNKNAKLTINDNAFVGVEADVTTPITDLTISIKRQAQMFIGDPNRAGGAFQVGNVVDGGMMDGSNARTVDDPIETYINFTLSLNGDTAAFHIDRNGFVGFGAGVVNKKGNPNGLAGVGNNSRDPEADTTGAQYGAWSVQSLWNVKNISLNVVSGYFDHNVICDGSSSASDGSVLAVGPIDYSATTLSDVNGGKYHLNLGDPSRAFIRGGGNVVYIDAGIPWTDPLALSIWDVSADIILNGNNSGKYTILAPSGMMRTYTTPIALESIVATLDSTGSYVSNYTFDSQAVSNANKQGGALYEFYATLSMPIYGGYKTKLMAAGANATGVTAGYLAGSAPTTIVRQNIAVAKDRFGNSVAPTLAIPKGFFSGTNANRNGQPEIFIVP